MRIYWGAAPTAIESRVSERFGLSVHTERVPEPFPGDGERLEARIIAHDLDGREHVVGSIAIDGSRYTYEAREPAFEPTIQRVLAIYHERLPLHEQTL